MIVDMEFASKCRQDAWKYNELLIKLYKKHVNHESWKETKTFPYIQRTNSWISLECSREERKPCSASDFCCGGGWINHRISKWQQYLLSQIQQVSWEQMYACGLEKKDTTQNIPPSPGTKSIGFPKFRSPKKYAPSPSVTVQRSQWVQIRKEHVKYL